MLLCDLVVSSPFNDSSAVDWWVLLVIFHSVSLALWVGRITLLLVFILDSKAWAGIEILMLSPWSCPWLKTPLVGSWFEAVRAHKFLYNYVFLWMLLFCTFAIYRFFKLMRLCIHFLHHKFFCFILFVPFNFVVGSFIYLFIYL